MGASSCVSCVHNMYNAKVFSQYFVNVRFLCAVFFNVLPKTMRKKREKTKSCLVNQSNWSNQSLRIWPPSPLPSFLLSLCSSSSPACFCCRCCCSEGVCVLSPGLFLIARNIFLTRDTIWIMMRGDSVYQNKTTTATTMATTLAHTYSHKQERNLCSEAWTWVSEWMRRSHTRAEK